MKTVSNIYQQQGVVIIVSLVFLVALTAVAAALMQNSTSDMKMSGASEEKSVAVQDAISSVDEVIYNQVAPGQTNLFARPVYGNNFPIQSAALLPNSHTEATATVSVENNQYLIDIACPHAEVASSTEVFSCNVLRIDTVRAYGRKDLSTISASSGIAQQLLK